MKQRSIHQVAAATAAALAFLLCAAGCRPASRPAGADHAGAAEAATAPASPPAAVSTASPVRFEDVTQSAGLTFAPPAPAARSPLTILDVMGCGCGFLDYDGDGFLDVLLVGSRGVALYRNQGSSGSRFLDVTAPAGLAALPPQGNYGMGCAVGDVDGDGDSDILLTGYGRLALLRNQNGRFSDVSAASGLRPSPDRWYTSAAFGDVDNDGLLDLYVGCYVQFDPAHPRACRENGVATACGPLDHQAQRGVLYRNIGHNTGQARFADVTKAWGADKTSGRTLGVLFWDYDRDGRLDLALANDETPGDLFHNEGKGLRNVALVAGTAYDVDGHVHGGMGVAAGDYDNDGRLDALVTVYENEATSLYRQEQPGVFQDVGYPSGLGAPTARWVGFGCGWLDGDNDGRLDVFLVNGHVRDNASQVAPHSRYAQPMQFLWQRPDGVFEDASGDAGPALRREIVGRGAAFGDYDNDGRVDVLVSDVNGRPTLLRNVSPRTGNWLTVKLAGSKSNRDGIGATVTLSANKRQHLVQATGGGSYLSANDGCLYFGLGAANRVDSVSVRWPSGRTDVYRNIAPNRIITLRENGGAR